MKRSLNIILSLCLALFCTLPNRAEQSRGLEKSSETAQVRQDLAARYPALVSTKQKRESSKLRSVKPLNPPHKVASAEAPTLYGCMIYNNSWEEYAEEFGVYSFPAAANTSFTPVETNLWLRANGGGVYVNGVFYCVRYIVYDNEISAKHFLSFDTESWERDIFQSVEVTSIALDMTYDPVSQKVFGCFYNANMDGYVFGTISLTDGSVTPICDMTQGLYVVAANAKGELYGIGSDGNLYRIDKENGSLTLIGSTGVKPKYIQSGTFDLGSGKLYWAASLDDESSALYEVNITTGAATFISKFANDAQITGLYTLSTAAPAGTPDVVNDLTAVFTEASTSGNIRFTLPTESFTGDPLSGTLDYTVVLDGTTYREASGACGEQVTLPLTLAEGAHSVSVTVSNSIGSSHAATIEFWVGTDIPGKVNDLQLSQTDKGIVIGWNPPTQGAHNGYLPDATYTYRIVRQPDNRTLATAHTETTYTDTDEIVAIGSYWYEVTAFNGTDYGVPTSTEQIQLGSAFIPPYLKSFADGMELSPFTVIDANNDGTTWSYDLAEKAAAYKYSPSFDANDWLISPPVQLEPGNLYEVSLKARSAGYTEKIRVALGNDATAEAMTVEIIPQTVVESRTDIELKGFVRIPEKGNYHIGVLACSERNQYNLFVSQIQIEISDDNIEPVSNLTVTAGAQGALRAEIALTAPSRTLLGKPLVSPLTKIELYREEVLIETFNNPATGAVLSYTDTEAVQGINSYKAIAYSEEGISQPAVASAYIGIDIPAAVSVIQLNETDGKAVLTWEAPQTGVNGGYIDPAALTYTIQRSDDRILAEDISALTYTDDELNTTDGQIFVYYVIYARSTTDLGAGGISTGRTFGSPYPAPFIESFSNASPQNNPWVRTRIKGDGYWEIAETGTFPSVQPQDADNGLISFVPNDVDCASRLHSPKIDISQLQNPILQFWVNHPGDNSKLTIDISTDGSTFTPALVIAKSERSGQWSKYQISLNSYKNEPYLIFGFTGSNDLIPDDYNKIHVDNARIVEHLPYDLSATAISGPKKLAVGESGTYIVSIENSGTEAAEGYRVELLNGSRTVQSTEGNAIAPEGKASFPFEYTATLDDTEIVLTARIVYANDLDTENNSVSCAVSVKQPIYPVVTGLKGTQSESAVQLTWNEPDYRNGIVETETDNIESYRAFSISGLGAWTLIDNDGAPTYGLNDGMGGTIQYDHVNEPMAFQVFNPSAIELEEPWDCHSGSQILACPASQGKANDDWLISPEISATHKDISFYAKSITSEYGLERFEVLYSNSGKEIEDFISIMPDAPEEAPLEWTLFAYELPASAKYFAIRCVSDDQFILLLDDICYAPAGATIEMLELIGYNVYRNGEKLTSQPIPEKEYTDTPAENGTYTYKVTVVYDKGESAYSKAVSIDITSGIREIGQTGITVYSADGQIVIMNAENTPIEIFTVEGRMLRQTTGDTVIRISVPAGTYIVRAGNVYRKVMVK